MRVLMLSTDQNIFNESSEVRQRMIEYGSLANELHIIVYTKRDPKNPNTSELSEGEKLKSQSANRKEQIADNVWVYPTNTCFKLLYFWDAYKICKQIIRNRYAQKRDPKNSTYKMSYLDHSDENSDSSDRFVITTQDPFETGLVGYFLKRKFKLPLQIQIHTDFLSPYFWQESLKNKIRVMLGKWLVKKAECLRVVSERIKDSLIVCYPALSDRIATLPIFVDTERIKSTPLKTDLHKKYPGYNFIILMASRLTKEKNIPMAIEAFASVKRQVSGVKNPLLLIVGDGPERKNLVFRIQNLGMENNIKIEDWTDNLVSYYKTADLFLNTSNYEGYGRTIIEALAAGCPVLTTDVGVAPEIIESGKSGIIIKPRDTKALIESISEIIRSRQNYRGQIREDVIKTKDEYLSQYKKTFSFCASRKN